MTWLKHNPNALLKLIEKHQNKNFEESNIELDLDASLYASGFFTKEENFLSREFHNSNQLQKIDMLNSMNEKGSSKRILKLAKRILGRHFFELLNEDLQDEYQKYLSFIHHKKPSTVDYKGKLRIDPNLILKETRELLKNSNNSSEDNHILNQLESLIEEKIQTQQDLGF